MVNTLWKQEQKRERLAKSLGLFGIGLGAFELLAPRKLAHLIGIEPRPVMTRLFGIREIASGLGILAQDHPTAWVWSRVAGDAMDLAALWLAGPAEEEDRPRFGLALGSVLGATVLDTLSAMQLTQNPARHVHHTVQTVTIERSPEELYQFWRRFENLPKVMPDLESVRQTSERGSHWRAVAPGGQKVEWDADIVQEEPNRCIAWRSRPDGAISHSGAIRFAPATGGRGTVVRVEINYRAPGGLLRKTVAKVMGHAPGTLIQLDLYRLKRVLETGEVITTEGQSAGRSSSTSTLYDRGTSRS